MSLLMDGGARRILEILHANHFEGYIVGGCVRDSLLGLSPQDWDITTNATPLQVKALFAKTFDLGLKHGTVSVVWRSVPYEVTTYRVDGVYSDGRRPDEVHFSTLLQEDLKRRDFTINALAYNEQEGLIDLFGGQEDLKQKIVTTVGEPEDRFREDALRILRAVRFVAQLGFVLSPQTQEAIACCGPLLNKVSSERIRDELNKILLSPYTIQGLQNLCRMGLRPFVLPELENQSSELFEKTLALVGQVPHTLDLRLCALFYYASRDISETALSRLKYSRELIKRVRLLRIEAEQGGGYRLENGVHPLALKRELCHLGLEGGQALLELRRALFLVAGYEQNLKSRELWQNYEQALRQIRTEGHPLTLEELCINGKDLQDVGVLQGAAMGRLLNKLLEYVWEYPDRNERSLLLEKAKELLAERF